MEIEQNTSSKFRTSAAIFEKASFMSLLVTVVLAILAFAPTSFISLVALKTLLVGLGTLVSGIFFVLSKMKTKTFTFSCHPIIWTAAAVVVVLLATLFSPGIANSFFGKDFAVDTGAYLLILFIAGALSFSLIKDHEDRIFLTISTILGSFSLLALFHIVRFFAGGTFLSLGTFTSMVYTTVGSWHDLGVLAGLALIISLVTLQLLPITNKVARGLYSAVFVLALIILIVVDLNTVWIIVAITALGFTAYKYILNLREVKQEKSDVAWFSYIPVLPLIVVVVALFLFWSPGRVGTFINTNIINRLNASYVEPGLTWQNTMDIAESTIKSSPVFGAGPDRFVNQYLLYKPEAINQGPYWASDFSNGSGFVLTSLVTEGIAGFVLWAALIVLFVWFGARLLLGVNDITTNSSKRYAAAVSYFGAGFLWLSLIDYMPQHAILLTLFVLTGIFVSSLISKPGKTVDFSNGRTKITALIIMWILIVLAAVFIVFYAKNAIAEAYFQNAVQSLNNGGSLSSSAQSIQVALKLDKSDVYYQVISQMDLYAVEQIVSTSTSTPSQSTIQLIGGLINDGVNSALLAQKVDPTNPYNYLAEAQVATFAAGIGEPSAYATATSSYQRALALDPLDPSIYLAISKLEFFEKNTVGAENDLNAAFELNPNYTDAIFEVGVISYTNKDYVTAVEAFSKVQSLDSAYPNIQSYVDLAKSAETTPPATTATAGSVTSSTSNSISATSTASGAPAKTTAKAK